jgi:hypothetical protein
MVPFRADIATGSPSISYHTPCASVSLSESHSSESGTQCRCVQAASFGERSPTSREYSVWHCNNLSQSSECRGRVVNTRGFKSLPGGRPSWYTFLVVSAEPPRKWQGSNLNSPRLIPSMSFHFTFINHPTIQRYNFELLTVQLNKLRRKKTSVNVFFSYLCRMPYLLHLVAESVFWNTVKSKGCINLNKTHIAEVGINVPKYLNNSISPLRLIRYT